MTRIAFIVLALATCVGTVASASPGEPTDLETDPCEMAREIAEMEPCTDPGDCRALDRWATLNGFPRFQNAGAVPGRAVSSPAEETGAPAPATQPESLDLEARFKEILDGEAEVSEATLRELGKLWKRAGAAEQKSLLGSFTLIAPTVPPSMPGAGLLTACPAER